MIARTQRHSLPRIAIAVLLTVTSACSTTTLDPAGSQTDSQTTERTWAAQRQQLSALQHWQTSGKIALRSAQASESARLTWTQSEQHSDITLNGPLGIGAMNIRSDGQTMVIERGKAQQIIDISTPESIAAGTGWQLPLQALPYWLKGAPSPDYDIDEITLSESGGTLKSLQQDGWLISYSKYVSADGLQLPAKLVAEHQDIRLKVILQKWQKDPSNGQ